MNDFVKNFLVLTAFAVLMSTESIFAQFSRDDAIDLVLNTILADDIGNVDVYSSYNSFTTDVELIDNDTPANPYSESWVFFSDDNPFASWYHSSRIIYVSTSDGSYTIENVEIYPKNLTGDYEEISAAGRPDPVVTDGTPFVPDPEKVASNYNYALIIVSMDNARNWHNTSLIYNVLMQNYNYQKDNIYILYNWNGQSGYEPYLGDLDGNGSFDDIDGPATWSNIQSTLGDLAASLGHGDQLAVFFTGVPVNDTPADPAMVFPVDQNNYVSVQVSDVSQLFDPVDCGQMILNFDLNSAEDVMSLFEASDNANALCQNRYITGSTGAGKKNYAEMYFSSGNYSEQLFYWASAARGYLPVTNEPWKYNPIAIGFENGGGFPYATVIPNHPGDNDLDDDGDGFIQMGEAFNYADDMNTWTDSYCHLPYVGEVPSPLPQQTDEIPFEEDLITLAGLSGYIENDQTMPSRSYIIADSINVGTNVSLAFGDYSEIYINRNSIIIVTNGRIVTLSKSSLAFGEHTFIANKNENNNVSAIVIKGDSFVVGDFSDFKNINLSLYNTSWIPNFSLNKCSFSNAHLLLNYCNTLTVKNSTFKNVSLKTWSETQTFLNNTFNETHCLLRGANELSSLIFDNCTLTLPTNQPFTLDLLLLAQTFPSYRISNNDVSNGKYGIEVAFSGWNGEASFYGNTIHNNDHYGVLLYNSKAKMYDNYIYGNGNEGLKLLNNSDIYLSGNKSAKFVYETQRIIDNYSYEVYSDNNSFPVPFRWNAIIDEDNAPVDDQLIYCSEPVQTEKDIRYNYWGENFIPEEDFFPVSAFYYEPVFELINTNEETDAANELFNSAQSKEESGDYSGAKSDYQQIITLYPQSIYATASIKKLFGLEDKISGDFNALLQYYQNLYNTNTDSLVLNIADVFSNKCNIKLQNWPVAINWFENRIQNPLSFADSIYAIIDLENTYLTMQNSGQKASHYVGSMPQYVPESYSKYVVYSNYLLSLLPGDKQNLSQYAKDNIDALKHGELLQNIPNPFSGSTSIYYKLTNDATVKINIFDYTGKQIKTYTEGFKSEGVHSVVFDAKGLTPGMYFYSIDVNGVRSDSKKMIVE